MRRYIKAVLGGILAILAAFGWVVAISFAITWKEGAFIWGVRNGYALWITLFLIFSAGFYLAFRATYTKISD